MDIHHLLTRVFLCFFQDESQETYSSRTGKGKAVDRHVHYECLGPEVLEGNYMDREIESITSVLGIKVCSIYS